MFERIRGIWPALTPRSGKKLGIWSLVQEHGGRTTGIVAGLGLVVAAVAALFVVAVSPSDTTLATHVDPVLVEANPQCSDVGQNELVRIDPVADGTFSVPGGSITIVVNSAAKTFDWTSTVGIEVIIVKGGRAANQYVYDPPAFADTGLHSPTNPKNGRFYGLSHISFCGPETTPTNTPVTPTNTATPPTITITPETEIECPQTPVPEGHRDPCLSPTETPIGPTSTVSPPDRT